MNRKKGQFAEGCAAWDRMLTVESPHAHQRHHPCSPLPCFMSQSCLTGLDDGLAAAGNLQFAEDIGYLIADRFWAQAQPFGDGGIGQSLRQELKDFAFT